MLLSWDFQAQQIQQLYSEPENEVNASSETTAIETPFALKYSGNKNSRSDLYQQGVWHKDHREK